MNQQQPVSPLSIMFNAYAKMFGWFILKLALKAIVVMLAYNLIGPNLLENFRAMQFGDAFMLTIIVLVLFGNLDGYSKFQNNHLSDINGNLFKLVNNQILQNNAIVAKLDQLTGQTQQSERIVPKTDSKVDNVEDDRYNTKDSENSNESK